MEKMIPSSYDVFDTLIARRFITNDYTLSMMESFSKKPNFAAERKVADTGSRSLYQIYEALVHKGFITQDELMTFYKLEVELEKKHTFPLMHINNVFDGDILISDMYLSGADILELVRNAGCNSQVTIYQSNADKRTGVVWDKLKGFELADHTGDNLVSDIENAQERGFSTVQYIDAVNLTGMEKILAKNNLNFMSALVREVRLRTPYSKNKELTSVANQLNLPMLLFICEMLHRKYAKKNMVFLGRDCQLLYKLYNAYYQTAYYVPFSRKVAYEQPQESVEYLKAHMPPDAVLVDMGSTGATWEHLCKLHPFNIEVVVYSDSFFYGDHKPVIPETFSWLAKKTEIKPTNEVMEVFNCADHGYLDQILNHNGVYFAKFGPHEMDEDDTTDIHYPINMAVETASNYGNNISQELSKLSEDDLFGTFSELAGLLCIRTETLSFLKGYAVKQHEYMEKVLNAKNS